MGRGGGGGKGGGARLIWASCERLQVTLFSDQWCRDFPYISRPHTEPASRRKPSAPMLLGGFREDEFPGSSRARSPARARPPEPPELAPPPPVSRAPLRYHHTHNPKGRCAALRFEPGHT